MFGIITRNFDEKEDILIRYYISDLHFFHGEMNDKMDQRGFESVEAMNEYMIEKWNSKVKKKDEVVIIGDFSFGKGAETNEILKRLTGRKALIIGNHDRFLGYHDFDKSQFEWIDNYREMSDNSRKVILSHYPILCYNGQYKKNKHDEPRTFMLYGHVHNTFDEEIINHTINYVRSCERTLIGEDEPHPINCNMINTFCKFSDYTPMSLDEWIEIDEKRRLLM